MKRIVTRPDGAKTVTDDPTSKAKGAAGCAAADAYCFKCRTQIGMEQPYHEVNGEPVHLRCTKMI